MPSIEYLEIRTLTQDQKLDFIGIVDEVSSVIWHTCYNSTGDFEIYAPFTDNNASLLVIGNFVCRSDRRDPEKEDTMPHNDIGIIESVVKTFDAQSGYMLTASGRMADSILDRRIIVKFDVNGKPNPTTLGSTVERKNVQEQLFSMMGTQLSGDRDIPLIRDFQTLSKSSATFDSERQVTYNNLYEYVQSVLQEFDLGLCGQLYQDHIRLYQYVGRETELVFSVEYDNLVSCTYGRDVSTLKTTALVGGEGEGPDRAVKWVEDGVTGYDRRELFVDDTTLTRKYTDDSGNEQTYSEDQFQGMLTERGSLELSKNRTTETVDGQLNVTTSGVKFRKDFYLGDVVTIEDARIAVTARVRITEVTEVQDADGYTIDMVFGG